MSLPAVRGPFPSYFSSVWTPWIRDIRAQLSLLFWICLPWICLVPFESVCFCKLLQQEVSDFVYLLCNGVLKLISCQDEGHSLKLMLQGLANNSSVFSLIQLCIQPCSCPSPRHLFSKLKAPRHFRPFLKGSCSISLFIVVALLCTSDSQMQAFLGKQK